jgi:hypothetical protein
MAGSGPSPRSRARSASPGRDSRRSCGGAGRPRSYRCEPFWAASANAGSVARSSERDSERAGLRDTSRRLRPRFYGNEQKLPPMRRIRELSIASRLLLMAALAGSTGCAGGPEPLDSSPLPPPLSTQIIFASDSIDATRQAADAVDSGVSILFVHFRHPESAGDQEYYGFPEDPDELEAVSRSTLSFLAIKWLHFGRGSEFGPSATAQWELGLLRLV